MGRSQNKFLKKEREKKKQQKKKLKQEKKEERKANATSGELDEMMAYLDENGNIVDTPQEAKKKKEIKAEDIEIGVPKAEQEDLSVERRGKITLFNDQKGFGFIKQNNSEESFFVHISKIKSTPREGDSVRFKLGHGPQGLVAIDVVIVK